MAEGWVTVWILTVVFAATVIRSAVGFGEALIAVPLLALFLPVNVAAPLAVLVSITVAAVIVAQDWRHVQVGSAWRLIVATLFGLPLGLLALKWLPVPAVKAALAVVILSFATYCLVRRDLLELRDDRLAWFFGFAAGVLGGAYGMNGPPLAVYGALRRWSAEHFRATLQGYFLIASLAGMIGYAAAGLWVAEVTQYFLMSLPVTVAALLLGRLLSRRLKGRSFLVAVYVVLLFVGAALLAQAVWGQATAG